MAHPFSAAVLNRRKRPDPYWNSAGTVLLLDCQGSNLGTAFVDQSPRKQVVTAVGNTAYAARIDLERGGGSCITVDGLGDAIKVASSTDFDFGAGDFTIEMDVLPTVVNSGWLVVRRNTTTPFAPFGVLLAASNNIRMVYASGTSSYEIDVTSTNGLFTNDRWHKVVFGRNGTAFGVYVDDVQACSGSASSSMRTLDEDIAFGAGAAAGSSPNLAGYFDNIRITKGYWRYPTLNSGFIDTGSLIYPAGLLPTY